MAGSRRSCQELWRVRWHLRPVSDLCFSPCNTRALSASHDGTLCLWESTTGRLIHALEHDVPIKAAAFGRDGRVVMAFCDDKTIHVWDRESGRRLDRFATMGRPGDYHTRGLGRRYPTASETGRLLVSGTSRGEVEIWDLSERRRLVHAKAHDGVVHRVACSPDGMHALSAGGDANDVVLWKLAY